MFLEEGLFLVFRLSSPVTDLGSECFSQPLENILRMVYVAEHQSLRQLGHHFARLTVRRHLYLLYNGAGRWTEGVSSEQYMRPKELEVPPYKDSIAGTRNVYCLCPRAIPGVTPGFITTPGFYRRMQDTMLAAEVISNCPLSSHTVPVNYDSSEWTFFGQAS